MDAARLASLWAEFKVEHARRYATAEEEEHRFAVFTANMHNLAEMQAEFPSEAPSGPSRYSDLTDEEVAALSASDWIEADPSAFDSILLCGSQMLTSHFPRSYLDAIGREE